MYRTVKETTEVYEIRIYSSFYSLTYKFKFLGFIDVIDVIVTNFKVTCSNSSMNTHRTLFCNRYISSPFFRANFQLPFFVNSFMQIALDMMQSCLQHLQTEVGFPTTDNAHGKLVERLCPDRLAAISEDPGKCNSLLLASPTTGRLVESLRRATSKSSGDGARLRAFKSLVGHADSLSWPVCFYPF